MKRLTVNRYLNEMNNSVGDNLLQLTYDHSKSNLAVGTLGTLIIGYFISQSIGTSRMLVIWTVVSVVVYTLRPLFMHTIITAQNMSLNGKLIYTALYCMLCGITIGALTIFFPQLDLSGRLFITLAVTVAGFGASTIYSGYLPFFICYATPMVVPLSIMWIVNPGHNFSDVASALFSAYIIFFMVKVGFTGSKSFNNFSDYINLLDKQKEMSTELSNALNNAEMEKQKAESSNRSKTRFLAAASHDLRQPVHVVSLFGAALQTMSNDAKINEVVKDMNDAIESLSSQLDALLDLSTLDSGVVKPDIKVTDLRLTVEQVANEFLNSAVEKNICLINNVDVTANVSTDKAMNLQILRNLVGNAIKYTSQGSVTINLNETEDYFEICCKDTGIGIDVNEQQHVFEEFYQIENPERNREKGLGLGLSIVARLAKILSHDIRVDSKIGIGTCVSIRYDKPNDAIVRFGVTPELLSCGKQNRVYSFWIHIVDDEPSVRKSMTLILEQLGCSVTSTSSTAETIEYLKDKKPDAVLIDLRLKGSDSGISTINFIKKMDPNIHCAIITGETYFELDDVNSYPDVQFLRKPINMRRLSVLLDSFKTME